MKLRDSSHPYALLTILLWSVGYVFTRLALQHFTPSALSFLRFGSASCVLLALAPVLRVKWPAKGDLKWFALSGASGFFLYMLAFNTGSVTVTASTTSVVIATTPVITALLARLIYKERLHGVQYVAIAVSFAGVVVLTAMSGGFTMNAGLAYLLAAAVFLSVFNLLQRKLTARYPALQVTAISVFLGTAMLGVFAPAAIGQLQSATTEQIVYALLLGVLSSAAAYCLWAMAFAKAKKTSSVSNYMFLTPFVTTLLSVAFAGESVDAATLVGGLVIFSGLLLFGFGGRLARPGS